jgi:hypothetical protein
MSLLRVNGLGGIRLIEIRGFLSDFEHAYNSIYTFETVMDALNRRDKALKFEPPIWGFPTVLSGRPYSLLAWPPTQDVVADIVPPPDLLVVQSVSLKSPGFWEFFGKLNPLEVIRQYLKDRHERRKDLKYREEAEARKLELENKLLENKVLRERIDIAVKLGATTQDLAPLLNELIYKPLRPLDRYQDRGVIEDANIV